jgi:hypothetical protein
LHKPITFFAEPMGSLAEDLPGVQRPRTGVRTSRASTSIDLGLVRG